MSHSDVVLEPPYSLRDFVTRARARLGLEIAAESLDVRTRAPTGDYRLNPSAPLMPGVEPAAVRLAAVLIGVVERDGEARVVLTQRTEHLPAHAGQVAFPGGKVEEQDTSPLATALRESEEEIGVEPRHVTPLGVLPAYQTATGFRIVPVVASLDAAMRIVPDPREVADVFEVPLSFLMDPVNHQRRSREWNGRRRYFFAIPYGERYVWGVTAGIIRELYEQIYR